MSEPAYERVAKVLDEGGILRVSDVRNLLGAYKDIEHRLRGARNTLETQAVTIRAYAASFSAIESLLVPRRGDGIVEQVRLLVEDVASVDVTREQLRASLSKDADPRWPEFSQ